jgi:hypothetical protein
MLPLMLSPLEGIFPSVTTPSIMLGVTIALIEALIGVALLIRRTRSIAVILASMMHLGIVALLAAKDYNQIVWVWNIGLIALVFAAFWRSDLSLRDALRNPLRGKDGRALSGRAMSAAKILVGLAVILPALSFVGAWDMYLSGALYSGNVEIGVVRVNEPVLTQLSSEARKSVVHLETGEMLLPLHEWSMAEINVPAYPERRVFRQIARELCKLGGESSDIELIVRGKPAIFDGQYDLIRTSCNDLEP